MMRSTFLLLISPLPSPVALALAASHAAKLSKNIGIASSDGSVAAGSPASTAAITNMNFIATLRLWPGAVTRTWSGARQGRGQHAYAAGPGAHLEPAVWAGWDEFQDHRIERRS